MLEAITSVIAVAFGGTMVFFAILGVCKVVEDLTTTDASDECEATEPRE